MARADLLKELLASYRRNDESRFEEIAEEIIEEERKKHHTVLANDLENIMQTDTGPWESNGPVDQSNLPTDSDSGLPLVEVKEPSRRLEDLVLDEKTLQVLQKAMYEFREWDVLKMNGLSPVHRILFCGPSGCGKTATAEAISSELGLPMLYVRFDAIVSSYLGNTSENLRKVFDFASKDQWVILFDEFDALGQSREDKSEHGEMKRVVNSLLQVMDNFQGRSLMIAATNYEESLDRAIWRRFDEVVGFDLPTESDLRRLIEKRLSPVEFDSSHVDMLVGNLTGATFADAERVCLDVRKSCVLRGMNEVTDDDIKEALTRFDYRNSVLSKAFSDKGSTD
ncbi:AAA family ATPase [Salinibacter ruber]|uniref:AAA family ATPase n=1 Tax=Salinibacter ruber TaxID=146919 RepID=UPI00216A3FE0|nr:ATP-binding protein [Salinibacter ruber]MCS3650380.1 SpoVK/Ycf46/Vps4 family AAA+-type ATPase [Salinibacter ruber]MCS3653632.1 SpoVK/Ycf46/Vps4 family AAA+-type ATPase [Salinibacter ruber]MCS4039727.1 SpoVK/Ycf46/Vps4 family AAA+-type ATPase [Salinibacter ruber]MCS4085832.1 SpoVK/Ycf46/Vps4 family AAA+-type ATPase [Salinibacter ruber]